MSLLSGKLYVEGIGERGPWDTGRLPFQDESVVEVLVGVGHRKATTVEELLAILRQTESGLPVIRTWVSEGLEGFARGLWEEYRR